VGAAVVDSSFLSCASAPAFGSGVVAGISTNARGPGGPIWNAGDPGTGVSGSTLGRCELGSDGTAGVGAVDGGGAGDAAVMLGVNLCGSLVG
jgi:hypothetical protein